jgi:rod shape-determining protein MreC
MFPKRLLLIVGVVVLIGVNVIILSVAATPYHSHGIGRLIVSVVAPLQETVVHIVRSTRGVWRHYFQTVSTGRENERLRKDLQTALARNEQYREVELANERLRSLLNFKRTLPYEVLPAEVVGSDPSSWFRSIVIDKGAADGVAKGAAIVVPEGITGQVVEVTRHYAKVMLIIDRTSAVDALIQRTRARGIIKGSAADLCQFQYVLRKHPIEVGDVVVSSGLDGVYPKGHRIGRVTRIIRRQSDIFQDVEVTPFVDFQKLEEVLVILTAPKPALGELR